MNVPRLAAEAASTLGNVNSSRRGRVERGGERRLRIVDVGQPISEPTSASPLDRMTYLLSHYYDGGTLVCRRFGASRSIRLMSDVRRQATSASSTIAATPFVDDDSSAWPWESISPLRGMEQRCLFNLGRSAGRYGSRLASCEMLRSPEDAGRNLGDSARRRHVTGEASRDRRDWRET
jgi:hypothetical protein